MDDLGEKCQDSVPEISRLPLAEVKAVRPGLPAGQRTFRGAPALDGGYGDGLYVESTAGRLHAPRGAGALTALSRQEMME